MTNDVVFWFCIGYLYVEIYLYYMFHIYKNPLDSV